MTGQPRSSKNGWVNFYCNYQSRDSHFLTDLLYYFVKHKVHRNKISQSGGKEMKKLGGLLAILLAVMFAVPAPVFGDGEGRFQAITIFRGSTPMVFILDTKIGNSWLWQKGSYTAETGIREEWSTISYQGRMIPGREGTPGQLISAPRWKLPESQ